MDTIWAVGLITLFDGMPDFVNSGIISSISFCPDYSGLYAASSLSPAVTLFSEATGSDPILQLDGMSAGITQVRSHPSFKLPFYFSGTI